MRTLTSTGRTPRSNGRRSRRTTRVCRILSLFRRWITDMQTASTSWSSAPVSSRSSTMRSTTSPEAEPSSFTVFTPTTLGFLGPRPRSLSMRSSEPRAFLRRSNFHADNQHYRILLPDLLLPPGHRPARLWQDQNHRHGVSVVYRFPHSSLMVSTDVFPLKDYQGALDKMASRGALKIAIRP